MTFGYLLEKSKRCLNRVKWASKSVKRLKITAINKETIWKRLSAILYTHGWVVYSQVVLLWWSHRFQIVSFSPSTLGKQRFQTVPFSNRSMHSGERFRNDPFSDRCSVDGSRIRNKTVSFSFEKGVVWTGSKFVVFTFSWTRRSNRWSDLMHNHV